MALPVKQIVIGRFLISPRDQNTYFIAPAVWSWANDNGYPVDPLTSTIAKDHSWNRCRNLENVLDVIVPNKETFSELMMEAIEKVPFDLNRFTTRLSTIEYAILLNQGGREVYDWFVYDHRFGPPPRGKAFRSNIRGEWEPKERKRPDNALTQLRRKITFRESIGEDVTELQKEYARREWCLNQGLDWKNPRNTPPGTVIQMPTRSDAP